MAELPGDYGMFGDGTPVVIKVIIPEYNSHTGVMHWKIGIRTLPVYEQKLGIIESEKDVDTGLIYRSYPKTYFHLIDPHPNTKTWLIACSFDNKSTDIIKSIGDDLFNKNLNYEKQLHSSNLKIARLQYEIKRLSKDPIAYYEKNILPMVGRMQKVLSEGGGGVGGN